MRLSAHLFPVGILFSLAFFATFQYSYATPFAPGQTLNPGCTPGSVDCYVATSTITADSLTAGALTLIGSSPQINLTYSATSSATISIDSSGNLNLGTQTNPNVKNGGFVAGINVSGARYLVFDTGSQTMAIGNNAFPSYTYLSASSGSTTPSYGITAIGDNALYSLSSTSTFNTYFDTAIGANALASFTGLVGSSNWNTAVGYSAGVNLINTNANTLIGAKAMSNATSSSGNVVVGDRGALNFTGTLGGIVVVGSGQAVVLPPVAMILSSVMVQMFLQDHSQMLQLSDTVQ